MEDFFNLPPIDEKATEEESEQPSRSKEELMVEAKEIYNALTNAEKIDCALPTVGGFDEHDTEMDDIARRAVDQFDELVNLGNNVPDLHAGKIFEVAGMMLKTAMEAKNAKTERKLKIVDLQIKKMKADLANNSENEKPATGGEFDRNELLRHLVSVKNENSDK